MRILVTGGAGYIGSHTCVELLAAGHDVVVFDNLCNSSPVALQRVERITGRKAPLIRGDVRDAALLDHVFREQAFDAVMHFAGLKAVGESASRPLAYYDSNVAGTLRLVQAMDRAGIHRLVFSSSATVYGGAPSPIGETATLTATSPYGSTKLAIERLLGDVARSGPWHMAILRYFNPVGAHASGLIGESPTGRPNNLMPCVSQVAVGRQGRLEIFGDDYPTPDGTAVRDYIHVVDLVCGHLAALKALTASGRSDSGSEGVLIVNLGTGRGYSVLEVLRAFETASGRRVPYVVKPRRVGDVATCFADPSLAERLLGWKAQRDLSAMCADAWRWQSQNPHGYEAS